MNDRELFRRDPLDGELAAAGVDALCADYCRQIALHILEDDDAADACLRDALEEARQGSAGVLAARPRLTLGRITRRLALERRRADHSAARHGHSLFAMTLEELDACVPAGSMGLSMGLDEETQAARVGASVNDFLRKQRREVRDIFICRYFYGDSLGEIARRFGLQEKRVLSLLHRTCGKLQKHLESEGIRL